MLFADRRYIALDSIELVLREYDIWNGEFWEHWSYPDED